MAMRASAPPVGSAPAPLGHKGPRGAILVELKRAHRLTAAELAGKLGISLNAIRHHLKELEAESLVEFERERRSVGAPVFAYRLSPAGEALFPRRYEATLLQVLDQVAEHEGREAAAALLESQFVQLARELRPELENATVARRVEVVTRALIEQGYMAEWEGSEAGGTLTEHNCAIHAVARRFPEVCAAEEKFFAETLGAIVERQAHMLRGCSACEYSVQFAPPEEGVALGHAESESRAYTGADVNKETS